MGKERSFGGAVSRERGAGSPDFSDDFDARDLDTAVWVPHCLPAVFDFPAKAASTAQPDHVPELAVDYVRGGP